MKKMETSRHGLQRIGSAVFALAALSLFALGILWPTAVEAMLHSRLAVVLIGVWSGAVACFLHPGFGAGLLQGIREFRKATDEVARDIRGGDDDDGPWAA